MNDLTFINDLPPAFREAILDGPAMIPPSGTPHFDYRSNKNALGYGLVITATILCTVLVSLRLYSRAFYHKTLSLGDGLTVAALCAFAGFTYVLWRVILARGLFIPLYDVRVRDIPQNLYNFVLGVTIYASAEFLLKAAILLEWVRIFVPRPLKNGFWWICHITVAVHAAFYITGILLYVFACNPRRKLWIPWLPGTCLNVDLIMVVSACVNFVLDIIVLILPQKVIWTLNSSRRRKFGVAVMFSVGIFACICAGVRIRSAVDYVTKEDVSFYSEELALWSLAELVSGFFILCLPAMPRLFNDSPWIRAIITTFKSSTKSSPQPGPGASRKVRTIGHGRQKRPDDASLFTDSDITETLPEKNIIVTTDFDMDLEAIHVRQNIPRHAAR